MSYHRYETARLVIYHGQLAAPQHIAVEGRAEALTLSLFTSSGPKGCKAFANWDPAEEKYSFKAFWFPFNFWKFSNVTRSKERSNRKRRFTYLCLSQRAHKDLSFCGRWFVSNLVENWPKLLRIASIREFSLLIL